MANIDFQKFLYEECKNVIQAEVPVCAITNRVCVVGLRNPWGALGHCPLHKQVLNPMVLPYSISIEPPTYRVDADTIVPGGSDAAKAILEEMEDALLGEDK